MNRLNTWLADFPTTQARVAFTLVCVGVTTARYLAWGVPTRLAAGNIPVVDGWGYWLIFLAGMSGLDVTAFALKRFSDAGYVAAKNANNQPDISVGGPSNVTVEQAAPTTTTSPVTPGASLPASAPVIAAAKASSAPDPAGAPFPRLTRDD